jgi:molybdenum storage protein
MSSSDDRHHLASLLARESLVDKELIARTDSPRVVRMLPDAHVIKIGGRSLIDRGRAALFPLVETIGKSIERHKLIIGAGGGLRSRHVFSIGMDLGLPTGVLAQLAMADANGNAHILGTLLAPLGVVAIPPEIFGHLVPLFVKTARAVIFQADPPYSLWEHPPSLGRIPPHRTDTGSYLVAECFGCASLTLLKDVDGLYDADPRQNAAPAFIREISTTELRARKLATLPFDRVLIDLLDRGHSVKRFQIINGWKPELLEPALRGEHVGTIVHAG